MSKVLPGVTEEGSVQLSGKRSDNFPMPYGNTGTWHKSDVYYVAGRNALPVAQDAGIPPDIGLPGRTANEKGTWDKLLYHVSRYMEAVEVNKLVRGTDQWPPQLVTQFGLSELEAIPNPLEFEVVYIVDKKNYGSRGSEAWQLITLPSIVHAYAKFQGWAVPEIEFRELTNMKDFVAFEGDELTELYNRYTLQRADLWKALGENNVKACTASGAKTYTGKRIDTEVIAKSDKLNEALHFATSSWNGEFYARIGQVCDPANAAGRVPVVVELYESKEDALEKLARKSSDNDQTPSEYAGLYFPESFSKEITVEEFISAIVSDVKPLWEAHNKATGAAKVKAKSALLTKLTEFEMSEEQFAEWAKKLEF